MRDRAPPPSKHATWEQGSSYAEDAREVWDRIEELSGIENQNACLHHREMLTELFGEECHYPVSGRAVEEIHDYTYLLLIVEAVQMALAEPLAHAA